MSFVVLGTDTDVGKTVVCAMLLAKLRTQYWKPIATGYPEMDDATTVRELTQNQYPILETLYVFSLPASPHLAAQKENKEIDITRLVEALKQAPPGTIIEGAGGVLVPLNDQGVCYADVIAKTDLPVILVTRGTLGTINHTLLSLEALRMRDVKIKGVIINGDITQDNARDIEHFGNVSVLGTIPKFQCLSPEVITHGLA